MPDCWFIDIYAYHMVKMLCIYSGSNTGSTANVEHVELCHVRISIFYNR